MRRVGGQQFVRAPGELVALARLGPDRQQPDPRRGHAQRGLGVGHAELAELDEHLRLGVRGRARVDEHRAARAGRQHDGQPGPQHAGQRPQPQPGGRHDAAGGPGRDHRGRVAAPDQLARHRHAGPRAAQAGQRALVHGQVVLGRHDLDLVDGAQPGQHLPQPRGGSGQQHPDAVLALGRERAGHDLVGGVVAAHGVDRDHRAGRRRARAWRADRGRPRATGCRPGAPDLARPASAGPRSSAPGRAPVSPSRAAAAVLAVRCRAQRVTGGRGRGWCLIRACPSAEEPVPGGPIMALARGSGRRGPRQTARPLAGPRRGARHCTAKKRTEWSADSKTRSWKLL